MGKPLPASTKNIEFDRVKKVDVISSSGNDDKNNSGSGYRKQVDSSEHKKVDTIVNNNNTVYKGESVNAYVSAGRTFHSNTMEIDLQEIKEYNKKPYFACPFWRPIVPAMQNALEAGKFEQASRLMHHCDGHVLCKSEKGTSPKESVALESNANLKNDGSTTTLPNRKEKSNNGAVYGHGEVEDNNNEYARSRPELELNHEQTEKEYCSNDDDNEEFDDNDDDFDDDEDDDEFDDEDVVFAPKLHACGVPHTAITAELNSKNTNKGSKKVRITSMSEKMNSNRNNMANATRDNG